MNARWLRAGAMLASALLVAGCSGDDTAAPVSQLDERAVGQSSAVPSVEPSAAPNPEPSSQPRARQSKSDTTGGVAAAPAAPRSKNPRVPPGDPGLDAPSAANPGVPKHRRAAPARTAVPTASMLDPSTVGSVLGGSWRTEKAAPPGCVSVSGAVARRSTALRSADGWLMHAVATLSTRDAEHAVNSAPDRLRRCGWTTVAAPRIGTASSAATHETSGRRLVAFAVDGVTVILVGSGRATSSDGKWSSLVDLALGSSCAASPGGCD